MKKLIALLLTLMLCFPAFAYADGEDDVVSDTHTEHVEVYTPVERGNYSVSISSSLDGQSKVKTGTKVTLTAHLSGFRDGVDTWEITWQENDGSGWSDVGSGSTYDFNIDEDNVNHKWRVVVHVKW